MIIDTIALIVIIAGAIAGAVFYVRSRREKKPDTANLTAEEREALNESPVCDPIRAELARYRAELSATPGWDVLRRGNISGAIALAEAELAECERVERRNRLR